MVTVGPLDAFAALPLPPSPGITVTPTDRLVTTEAGGTDAFTAVLNTRAGIVAGLTDTGSGDLVRGRPNTWTVRHASSPLRSDNPHTGYGVDERRSVVTSLRETTAEQPARSSRMLGRRRFAA